ncbi:hypothetical protein [Vibrio sp. M260112]|uniref:hypothetical protein n=1 Tax=Vibrio sp. M260112 TaxID=3020895 RepID=UPI002F408246
MYFWAIDKLKEEFITGTIKENELVKYFIAHILIVGAALSIPYQEPNIFDLVASILSVFLCIVGVLYAYRCNGADKGSHFIAKFLAISWVMFIKFLFSVFLFYALIMPLQTNIWDVLVFGMIEILFYWRVAFHIKGIETYQK